MMMFREQDVIRPATCEGGGEARRSRWTKTFDQQSVINKNKEEEGEGEKYSGTSKFEAALKDLEALGRGQGTRYFLHGPSAYQSKSQPYVSKLLVDCDHAIDIGGFSPQVGGSPPAKGVAK